MVRPRRPTRPRPWRTLAAAVALASAGWIDHPLAALEGAWDERPQVAARLVTPYLAAPRQGEFQWGVEFRLAAGWHAYWKNSGDAGFAPVFDFSGSPELEAVVVDWPAPRRFLGAGGLVSFGYERSVLHPATARLRPGLDPRLTRLDLVGDLDILVCAIECVPHRLRPTVSQPLAPAAGAGAGDGEPVIDPPARALLDAWRRRVPRPASEAARAATSWHPAAAARPARLAVRLRPGGREAWPAADLFFESHEALRFGAPRRLDDAPAGEVAFEVPVAPLDATRPLPVEFDVAWVLTLGPDAPSYAARERVARGAMRWSAARIVALAVAVAVAVLAGVTALRRITRGLTR